MVATILVILFCLTAIHPASAQQSCPTVEMLVERLPNLNIPRIGHSVFCVNGEIVAAGGHTTSFVPTQTAEYYRDGEWHLVQMAYPHDQGTVAVTEQGQVLLAGGHEKELGIGQTFTLELYTPATHSFKGYGCLDKKRCFANALPVDSGRIVISGNWYHDDGIELYDGSRQSKFMKSIAQHRSLPYIIRSARDNAIIFSDRDNHAQRFDTIVIDRLKGEPFTVPLFDTWRPFYNHVGHQGVCFIGNEQKGDYTSLIQVMQGDSLMAIARVQGEAFSLLPTTCPIPMQSRHGHIGWFSYIMADCKAQRAYIVGYGEDTGDHRLYAAAIDYSQSPAPITLYYSEPQDSVGRYQPVLTDDGNLMLVGGIVESNNNYDTSPTVLLLHVSTEEPALQESWQPLWLWIVLAFLLLSAIAITVVLLRRCKKSMFTKDVARPDDSSIATAGEELMERICRYMEEQQPYLSSELKVQDVADALGTNRTYVSNSIRSQRNSSFTQFVNTYRIAYAQQLLRQHPDKKISEVSTASGFSIDASFFRTFKAATGMSPSEWREKQQ